MGWGRKAMTFATSLLIGLVILALGGCSITPERTPSASPDWSRGKTVGLASTSDQVAIQTDDEGNAYLAWVGLEKKIELAKLDKQAQVVAHRSLDLPVATPKAPQLLLTPQDKLHLIWLEGKRLYYAQLGPDGEVLSGPLLLSLPEREADWARMVPGGRGGAEVFWSDDSFEGAGLYHVSVGPGGEVIASSSLIMPGGMDPSPQVDRGGVIHLAWFQRPRRGRVDAYYGTFDPARRALEGQRVASFNAKPGTVIEGPEVGLDEGNVYVFWAQMRKAWQRMVSHVYYVAFPLGHPRYQDFMEVKVPGARDPRYEPAAGYNYRVLAPLKGASTHFLGGPKAMDGQGTELLLAFHMMVTTRMGENLQIIMVVFAEGQPKGYQIVTKTGAASLQPNLVADPADNLHLAWFDTAGFGRLRVLYASTSPLVKGALNPPTAADVIDRGLSLTMSLLSILAFIPVFIVWAFLPTLWLLFFYLFTDESRLETRRAWWALGLAALLLFLSKVFAIPPLLGYVPFLHLLPPQFTSPLTRWVIPLSITAIAMGITIGYLKRARSDSLFRAYFTFALLDGFLSLSLYVPTLMGYL